MTQIRLLPVTKRLKQRIKQDGEIWNVILHPRPVQCWNGELAFCAESLNGRHTCNFKVTEVEIVK